VWAKLLSPRGVLGIIVAVVEDCAGGLVGGRTHAYRTMSNADDKTHINGARQRIRADDGDNCVLSNLDAIAWQRRCNNILTAPNNLLTHLTSINMKFFTTIISTALCLGAAIAQTINIASPLPGDSVQTGKDTVITVVRPNSLTGSIYVGLVIGIAHCPVGMCPPANQTTGTVLYNGDYNPQYATGAEQLGPHQNFTVTIPSDFDTEDAMITATLLQLTGASNFVFLQIVNVTGIAVTSPPA